MTDRPSPDDPTIGRLVADASRDISTLVSKEIELAKSELKVSFKAGGLGVGMFAGAAFLLLLGVIFASISLAYFFNWLGLGLALSFLMVFVVYLVLAAILGLLGYRSVKKVGPPEKAIEQGKGIPRALKGKV
ncbi:phage holin family protein [Nocardioides sp.]|uniref:phage holin family protein n=1 Tax=Nocardioides sp. TaxID=35761 RepID=UPI003569ECF0